MEGLSILIMVFSMQQVVAIGGTNNLGKCVVVKNTFSPRPLPFPEAPLKIDRNTGVWLDTLLYSLTSVQ